MSEWSIDDTVKYARNQLKELEKVKPFDAGSMYGKEEALCTAVVKLHEMLTFRDKTIRLLFEKLDLYEKRVQEGPLYMLVNKDLVK